MTPPAASVATSAPESAQQANVEAATQAAAIPKRLFSPVLRRLGFVPGKLYGVLIPLAHDHGRVVLFGCLRGLTTLANAQMVLRAHVSLGSDNCFGRSLTTVLAGGEWSQAA